jgi:hypothetical protein
MKAIGMLEKLGHYTPGFKKISNSCVQGSGKRKKVIIENAITNKGI